jgi:hypothetical protein
MGRYAKITKRGGYLLTVYLCYVDGVVCAVFDNANSAYEYIEAWRVLEQKHQYKINAWSVRS